MEGKIWATLTALYAAAISALGGWDSHLATLFILIVIDYALGAVIALVWRKSKKGKPARLESHIGFKGFVKKGVILCIVYVAHRLGLATNIDWLADVITICFICNEAISILEHAKTIGIKPPAILSRVLDAVRRKANALSFDTNETKKEQEA